VIPISRSRCVLAALLVVLVAASTWVWARSSANIALTRVAVLTVDTSQLGSEFAPGTVGISTEASELETDHLRAGHPSLVRLMRMLGPSVLRIGGNSVDVSWWTSSGESAPGWATNTVTPVDLSVLHDLLAATGWRVLLGVDLGHFEPVRAADEVRYAREILGTDLIGVEIGNEPDDFGHQQVKLRPSGYGISEYLREAEAYVQALTAAAPGVAIYGPALTQDSQWLIQMGDGASMFAELTKHYYPTSGCPGTPTSSREPPPTAAGLLSPVVRQREDDALAALARTGTIVGRPTRIGETNSVACGGSASASPVFASALWSLDWALRAAQSGVNGLNFHAVFGPCGSHSYSPICAPNSRAAATGDVLPQPEYYGLLAASRLEGGRFVPTSLSAAESPPNLTSWATVAPGGTVRIAIDNLNTAGVAQPVDIPMSGYTATVMRLVGAAAGARRGITLGAAQVTSKGQWRPRSTSLLRRGHSFHIVVPATSAVIITLSRAEQHR